MAAITNPDITNRVLELANSGIIDVSEILSILNEEPNVNIQNNSLDFSFEQFKRFNTNDITYAQGRVVKSGMWSTGTDVLTTFFTSSTQNEKSNSDFYYDVYNLNPNSSDLASVEFSVSYGNINGSGSIPLSVIDIENTLPSDLPAESLIVDGVAPSLTYDRLVELLPNKTTAVLPTKLTYLQYKNLLLPQSQEFFQFPSSSGDFFNSDSIYVINISRENYRQAIDVGNWELTLNGSNGTFTFIDNSEIENFNSLTSNFNSFKVVRGTLNLGTDYLPTITAQTASNGQGFGIVYPNFGIIVLNPYALGVTVGNITGDGAVNLGNISASLDVIGLLSSSIAEFSASISNGIETTLYEVLESNINNRVWGDLLFRNEPKTQKLLYYSIKNGGSFKAKRVETIKVMNFTVRATNAEFNFTNNPTLYDSNKNFIHDDFKTNPKTYVTTIGFYNDDDELLAVGKLSEPIKKSFDDEFVIKARIPF